MTTTVLEHLLVPVPPEVAAQAGIKPGTVLECQPTNVPGVLHFQVVTDRASIATKLQGAGVKYLKPGNDSIAKLFEERHNEEIERKAAL